MAEVACLSVVNMMYDKPPDDVPKFWDRKIEVRIESPAYGVVTPRLERQ